MIPGDFAILHSLKHQRLPQCSGHFERPSWGAARASPQMSFPRPLSFKGFEPTIIFKVISVFVYFELGRLLKIRMERRH